MLKRFLSLLLAILFVVFSVNGFAESVVSEQSQFRYTYIMNITAGLNISGTSAICLGLGNGMYSDTTTYIYVRLQQKPADHHYWSTIESWTATASGIGTAQVYETCSVTAGCSYRVAVRCQIRDANGAILETAYQYSPVYSI